MTALIGVSVAIALANLVLLVVVARRLASDPIERAVREELRQSREESASAAKELRDEIARVVKDSTDTLVRIVG
jgi:hypothetical protein